MKNYTHILNEGFDSYFKKLNEVSSFDYGDSPYIIVDNIEWDTEGEYVDNLPDKLYVPYDELLYREESLSDVDVEELKDRIADYLSNEYGYLVFGFDTPANDTVNLDESKLDEAVPRDLMSKIQDTDKYRQYQLDKYSDNPNIRDNHEPLDYQSANMEEITSKDVLQMKRDGNDLSNIYILDSNDNLIELDKDGHPLKGGSTGRPRANQSLKKTLSDAKKIYIGKIDYVSKTQPDKWAERTSDTSRRGANLELGSKHSNNNWKSNFYNDLEKYGKEINRLKKAYEEGNISKKYMEKKISELKRDRDRGGSWDEYMYSLTKDGRAFDRYYDSNIASRENTDAYEEAKVAINLSNRIIEYCERELAKNSSKEKAKELKREINIEKQRIKDNQAIIDKLLRRNKKVGK